MVGTQPLLSGRWSPPGNHWCQSHRSSPAPCGWWGCWTVWHLDVSPSAPCGGSARLEQPAQQTKHWGKHTHNGDYTSTHWHWGKRIDTLVITHQHTDTEANALTQWWLHINTLTLKQTHWHTGDYTSTRWHWGKRTDTLVITHQHADTEANALTHWWLHINTLTLRQTHTQWWLHINTLTVRQTHWPNGDYTSTSWHWDRHTDTTVITYQSTDTMVITHHQHWHWDKHTDTMVITHHQHWHWDKHTDTMVTVSYTHLRAHETA